MISISEAIHAIKGITADVPADDQQLLYRWMLGYAGQGVGLGLNDEDWLRFLIAYTERD